MSKLDSLVEEFYGSTKPEQAQPSAPAHAGGVPSNVRGFVERVAPLAKSVGERLNVDPSILIGQWGIETGWGKSVIPGTNNLGNIKDFSGRGAWATDNMTGSRDAYRQYASLDDFGGDYASLIERRYGGAIGAGSDAGAYAGALKAGGYAEDPDYVAKMIRATEMVRGAGVPQSAPRRRLEQAADAFMSTNRGAQEQAVRDQEAMIERGRSIGEMATDTGLAVTSGAAGIASLVGTGVGLATGDMDNFLRSGGEDLRKWAQENQSKVMQAQKSLRQLAVEGQEDEAGKFFAYLSETLGSPALAIDFMAEQAPQLIVMGGAGRAAVGAAKLAGAGTAAAGSVGTGAAIGAGSSMQGLDAAGQAYDQIMALPRAVQLQNPAVQKLIAAGTPEGEAVERVARAEATTAGFASGATSAALNMLPWASTLERSLAGVAVGKGGRLAGALKGFAGEGISEGLDESGGVLSANYAAQQFDPTQDLTEGVGEAAAAGALFAPFGGVAGAMQTAPQDVPSPVVRKEPKPNSPLQNAANAAAASAPQAPAGGAAPVVDPLAVSPDATADDAVQAEASEDPRLARARSFVEDRTFINALRNADGFGKESVADLLSAYAKARNPNVDAVVRERALADIDRFITTFVNRPNFTFGKVPRRITTTRTRPMARACRC